ncbi:MAG: hypothetical protein ACI376_05230 [Candidatus Bruticola sp.]
MLFTINAWKKTKNNQRGVTIIELLICCALIVTFLSLVGRLASAAANSCKHSEKGMRAMRSAALSIDNISRDLRSCQSILWPKVSAEKWRDGYSVKGDEQTVFKFIFRQSPPAGGTSSIIGYHWDSVSRELTKCVYRSNFIPQANNLDDADQMLSQRILARDLSAISINSVNCRMRGGAQFLELSLTVSFNELERGLRQGGKFSIKRPKLDKSIYTQLEIRGDTFL